MLQATLLITAVILISYGFYGLGKIHASKKVIEHEKDYLYRRAKKIAQENGHIYSYLVTETRINYHASKVVPSDEYGIYTDTLGTATIRSINMEACLDKFELALKEKNAKKEEV